MSDEIRFDGIVFFKEQILIDHQILDDLEYGEGLDEDLSRKILHQLLAGQTTEAIDSHPIRTADPVSAGHPEGQGGVLL